MDSDEQISQLLAAYGRAEDAEDVAGLVALFTADGRLVESSGTQVAGHAALQTFLADGLAERRARDASSKQTYASSVIEVDGDTAVAKTDFVRTERVGTGAWSVAQIGRCHDQLVHRAGTWLFAERLIADARTRA